MPVGARPTVRYSKSSRSKTDRVPALMELIR